MTKNLTLRMDEELLRKAKHAAVESDQSVSDWVRELVARELSPQRSYEDARRRALRRLEKGFHLGGKTLTREDLHERR